MSDLEGLQHYHSDALTEYDRFGMRVYPPARIASDLTALAYDMLGEPPAPTVEERIALLDTDMRRCMARIAELERRLDEQEAGK